MIASYTAITFGDEDKKNSTMATHGTVSAFEPGKEDWSTYVERLNHYFVANGVEDAAKKRAILLTACGASTYKLIRSLLPTAEAINTTSYTLIS